MSSSYRIWTTLLAAFLALSVAGNAFAQDTFKVGVVDFREALQATEAEGALSELQDEGEKRKKDLNGLETRLYELETQLQEGADTMTEQELKDTVMEYRRTAIEYRKAVAELEQDLISKRDLILGTIHEEMELIARQIARDQGIDIMLEKNAAGVIFHDGAIDLTGELIQRYSKAHQ